MGSIVLVTPLKFDHNFAREKEYAINIVIVSNSFSLSSNAEKLGTKTRFV
jgi:hypothetical protein